MTGILEGIITGGAGGAFAGIVIWGFKYIHEKVVLIKEKNRVFKWLKDNSEDGKLFRSTRAIASWNNLSEDRVRYVCSVDKRIFLSTGEKTDRWGLECKRGETGA